MKLSAVAVSAFIIFPRKALKWMIAFVIKSYHALCRFLSKEENMLESLIITLREGIEVALLVGILLSYLKKVEKEQFNVSVYTGLGMGVILSFLVAFIFSRVEVNEEVFEGTVMLLGAFFVATMVVWMWRTAKTLKKDIEGKVETIVSPSAGGRWSFSLIGFVTLCVLREGFETVVFLSAVSLSTSELLGFLGGISGLVVSVIFGYLFVRGSLSIDLPRFFKVTGAVLLIFAFQLVVSGLHEFGEVGFIPVSDREMAFIGPVVKHNMLFLLAILSIPLFAVLFPGKSLQPSFNINSLPSPEKRKAIARGRAEQRFRVAASVSGFVVLFALSFSYVQAKAPRTITPPVIMTVEGDEVKIPVSGLSSETLYRYAAGLEGKLIRFLVMKTREGNVLTAFDACKICGSKGYVQEGKNLVCLNCAADIQGATMGEGGGCNPIPLSAALKDGMVIVKANDLLKEAKQFATTDVPEVADPVCGMKFKLDQAGGQAEYKGKIYYMCRMPACKKEFEKHPEKFIK